ncbi:MAG: NAD(P)-dependent oxidoreductase [Proteobacteria bacterium]|nr:NAD(P)-dependent oxidoreductase [Pseudomonadota bacterium]
MKAGFIGLGNLGKAMVKRLLSENVEVSVWNRTKEKAKDINVSVSETVKDLVEQNEIIFLNLFDSNAVEEVFCREGGVLSAGLKNKIIVDTTTNHYKSVLNFHKKISEKGGHYLEAPVLGSVIPASTGNLTIIVSGEKEAYEKALPYLKILGSNIFFVERAGLATQIKLINNLLLGVFMVGISEALAIGDKAGIDRELLIDILSKGAGNSMVLNAKREKLIKEDFSPHFSSALIYKDLHYLQDLAKDLKSQLFLGSLAKEIFGLTYKNKEEELDFSAVFKIFK